MFTQKLQDLMHKVNIPSFRYLSRVAGVSQWQISQLRQGNISNIRLSVLLNISQALQISLDELLLIFSFPQHNAKSQKYLSEQQQIEELKKEYQRLSLTLSQQQEVLQQQFQQSSLQILESLLLQWPTVVYKVSENPELTAIKILPLVTQSLEKLLQAWEVTKIGAVGAEVFYNPQLHQLVEGNAEVGELVKVRRVGYIQNGRLLHRATVIKM